MGKLYAMETPDKHTTPERFQLNAIFKSVIQEYHRECYYLNLGIFEECESIPRFTSLHFFGSP